MTDSTDSPHPSNETGAAPPGHLGTLELEQNDYSKYLLYSRSEITYVLRSVIQKGCMLSVYFDSGRHFFLTALMAISDDGNWLYFDMAGDESINIAAQKTSKLMLTTMLDKVKIQFSLSGLQTAQAGNRKVFAGRIPETILRLQRREYYRLSTPIANPLKCAITIPRDSGPVSLEVPVLDISGGGVGLQIPADAASRLEAGTVLSDCRINLPEEGIITTSLCVRNSFNVTTKSGQTYLRIGCEYVDLPGTRLTLIQRYITRIERERKARAEGNV